jgi:hypothetical protein
VTAEFDDYEGRYIMTEKDQMKLASYNVDLAEF